METHLPPPARVLSHKKNAVETRSLKHLVTVSKRERGADHYTYNHGTIRKYTHQERERIGEQKKAKEEDREEEDKR